MDKIYPPEKFSCSEPIPLKKYFSDFSKLVELKHDSGLAHGKLQGEIILNVMGVTNRAERKKIRESCSLDLLTCEDENLPRDVPSTSTSNARPVIKAEVQVIPDQAKQLHTVQLREQLRGKFQTLYNQQKDQPYIVETDSARRNVVNETRDIDPGKEFAVSIRVYHPFEFKTSTQNSLKFSHEIVAIGSNTLSNLRDKILCQADIGLCTEVEDPTEPVILGNAKAKYPSGFIFIENTFYNDFRAPNAFDYSEVIRKWAEERGIGPLSSASMESTRLNDLQPRFGYPYIYHHQGNCEHILVFSSAWLLTGDDALDSTEYPLYKGVQILRSVHCTLCYASNAKWIVVDSDRLPHQRTFMCQDCLLQYHYRDGEKLGSFRLYPFFERSRII